MKFIKLTRGKFARVDDRDFESLSRFKWHAVNHGKKLPCWYAARTVYANGKFKTVLMHVQIAGRRADHQNGDGLDNTRSNLRPATQLQNCQNRRKSCGKASRFKGLTREGGKWRVRLSISGKRITVGRFKMETVAALAYDAAARNQFGKFAKLNFS